MKDFDYDRAQDAAGAVALAERPRSRYLGGGTNLVDLMRENVEQPDHLVDVTRLPRGIEERDGAFFLEAATKNSAVAEHEGLRQAYPVLSQALLAGASGQIRNMATVAGNILQRTRCYYFYDTDSRCNKRQPGAGCDAREGFNRIHAVLGGSESCIATHPSDMCVALAALDARVHLQGAEGTRVLDFNELRRLPGDTPHVETELRPGELITRVEIPGGQAFARNSTYRKVRDRASYAFALVSVAAALEVEAGKIKQVRLALGGVAPKPWRARIAEAALLGQPANEESFRKAISRELEPACGLIHNGFKIELARRTVVGVLKELLEVRS
jgi:xanthine dehydrogenase YagS FAD-binding subunit